MAEILSERPTDQLRYVTRRALMKCMAAYPHINVYDEWQDIAVGVQRLWYVQTEPLYCITDSGPPNSVDDVFTHCDGSGSWYAPMRPVWRTLESVTEAEANQPLTE